MQNRLNQIIQQSNAEVNQINSDAGSPDYRYAERKHEEVLVEAAETGTIEGQKNYPGGEVSMSDYEQELITKYGSIYRTRVSNEMSLVQQLKARYNTTLKQLYTTNEGSLLYRITDIKTNFQKAKIDHGRPTGETNAIKALLERQWIIYLVLIILGIMELPLNNTVFKAFRLGAVPTLMAGTLLVIAIPIMAHFGGKFMKRWKEGNHNKLWTIFLVGVLAAFSMLISLFRFVYFQGQDILRESLESGEEIAFTQIMNSISLSHAFTNSEFLVALIFNILLIGVGIVLGFMAHDSKGDFEKHYKNFNYERPRLIKQFNEMIADNRKASQMNNGKSGTIAEMLEQVTMITELHNVLSEHIVNFGDYMNSLCHEAISRYRQTNRRHRSDQESVPVYWQTAAGEVSYIAIQEVESIRQDEFGELIHHHS